MPLKEPLKMRESVYKTWKEDSDWEKKKKQTFTHIPNSRDFKKNWFYIIHMLHFIMIIYNLISPIKL